MRVYHETQIDQREEKKANFKKFLGNFKIYIKTMSSPMSPKFCRLYTNFFYLILDKN